MDIEWVFRVQGKEVIEDDPMCISLLEYRMLDGCLRSSCHNKYHKLGNLNNR